MSLHVEGEDLGPRGGVTVTSGTSARAVRGATTLGAAERTELRPCAWAWAWAWPWDAADAARSWPRRKVDVEDAGLCARGAPEAAVAVEGRRAEKVRWRLRSGEGAEKMPCELRDLRGVEGPLGVSARGGSCGATSDERGEGEGRASELLLQRPVTWVARNAPA